jgi:hypothetical protein
MPRSTARSNREVHGQRCPGSVPSDLGTNCWSAPVHSSLEGLTDKGALCSGNCNEQFYTDATRPSDLACSLFSTSDAGGGSGGANGAWSAERPC